MIWTYTESGGRMPLDASPSPKGTHLICDDGSGHLVAMRQPVRELGRMLYVSHFATCPQAASWRKRAPK